MEVFKSICEHVAGDEFEKNQMEFVFANCAKFDEDAEENKLEYDNIHKEYVHILEQLIEVKLKAKFSDEEVNEFTLLSGIMPLSMRKLTPRWWTSFITSSTFRNSRRP